MPPPPKIKKAARKMKKYTKKKWKKGLPGLNFCFCEIHIFLFGVLGDANEFLQAQVMAKTMLDATIQRLMKPPFISQPLLLRLAPAICLWMSWRTWWLICKHKILFILLTSHVLPGELDRSQELEQQRQVFVVKKEEWQHQVRFGMCLSSDLVQAHTKLSKLSEKHHQLLNS